MGLFDSVYVPCANCGTKIEYQSKAGECYMHEYDIETASTEVLMDVINDPRQCYKCGKWNALVDSRYPPDYRPPHPNPTARILKEPKPESVKGSPPYSWLAGFSFDDLE